MAEPTRETLRRILEQFNFNLSDEYIEDLRAKLAMGDDGAAAGGVGQGRLRKPAAHTHYDPRADTTFYPQSLQSLSPSSARSGKRRAGQPPSYITRAEHSPRELSGGLRKSDPVARHNQLRDSWAKQAQRTKTTQRATKWDTKFKMLPRPSSTITRPADPVTAYHDQQDYWRSEPFLDSKLYRETRSALSWETRCGMLMYK
eukprot:TRINITY_DN5042_c0_g1_i1.p1 TRINITY_DN5042_c0_g1~~TRINITY_DN5042_c0_g1_i1.p1  ORF type:complete len:226 (+),score=71.26 TRINITY_DN5042_c0_g1_i1:77-679(+)